MAKFMQEYQRPEIVPKSKYKPDALKRVSIYLLPEQAKKLREVANHNQKSLSYVVRKLIDDGLDKEVCWTTHSDWHE